MVGELGAVLGGEAGEACLVLLNRWHDHAPVHRLRLIQRHGPDNPIGIFRVVHIALGPEVLLGQPIIPEDDAELPVRRVPPLMTRRRVDRPAEPITEELESVEETGMMPVNQNVH